MVNTTETKHYSKDSNLTLIRKRVGDGGSPMMCVV